MLPSPETARKMSGREVLSLVIDRLRDRAAYGRDVAAAYGEGCDGVVLRDAAIWDALATGLQIIAARGEIRIEDRSKDKDGKPLFVSKIRHEIDGEIAQIFASAFRGAFLTEVKVETKNVA